ncbi:AAA family ATPase [Spirosoma linguale]|uniref:SMC domain protein n=1 Tax=Spirosoma linguale (strain ATCC 33905 / DSM 74 / LMG 10896 / Claus 1) TaxID=504472 RepID=D2QSK8_SPILD|nr:SMC domain protein [Spirosoma linguale DSM 74]
MLKRVSIQNFKSLKDVTLDLQKVNLLIGPNNSGKTNFLKALEFFDYAVLGDSFTAEQRSRDFRFMRSADFLSIGLAFQRQDEELLFLREIVFSNTQPGVIDTKSSQLITKDGIEIAKNDQGYLDNPFLRRQLSSLRIYRPDPNKLTQPGPVGTGAEMVSADASNLIGFLDRMLGNKYRKSVFNRIETDLQTCVPEFDEINIDDESPTEELKRLFPNNSFKRLGLTNSKQDITYWADELSEGTLYFLALLCIINQPNPPKLLLLEEPEKGIHPRRIFEVIQFIFRLAEEKDIQVILTTHSPLVVDMFKDMPESVFIFDKDDEGATRVKNLQRDVIEPETVKSEELGIEPPHYTDSLGDAWTVGFLGGVPK